MPEISVILPAYNRIHSLKKAIQSVLKQTYQDFELIIVDDGSTDETATYVQGIEDSRLTYIVHQVNKGAAAARNTGMRLARGSYIAFLDSDDSWVLDKLDKQLKFLKLQPETIGGCVSYYHLQFAKKSIIRKISIEADFYQQSLKGCNLSPGSTLLFKKDCLSEVGYQDETLKRFEDWEWQIRFSKLYQWQMLPEVLAGVKAGHIVDFDTAKQALEQLSELTKNLPIQDKKIIKMAISYELFYAALKNRLFKAAFNAIAASLLSMPVLYIKLIIYTMCRKTRELFY